ncbi:hypothetical protein ACFYO7_32390 [Nocardia salmonicida]|uniref:hypothetical protein n=1 Tax=Nocardia salmonicida TaxID=53431 RepID=UPI0036B8EE46
MDDVADGRLRGVLIVEALRPDAELVDLDIVVSSIRRTELESTAPGQPPTWTLIDFEADERTAGSLAEAFADALRLGPWYVDFRSARTTFVCFAGRVFSYAHGDGDARALAVEHGRAVGVPEEQLDWAAARVPTVSADVGIGREQAPRGPEELGAARRNGCPLLQRG